MKLKHVKEMSPDEKAAALAELRKGPAPEPLDMSKTAREMSAGEREAFLKECARRAG
jgi:hypothetical protein